MRLRRVLVSLFAFLITLPTMAAITGSVINTDGQPIVGAKVSIFVPETADGRRARLLSKTPQRTPAASVQTDSKGNFSIDSPKEPVLDLRVEASGYAPDATRALPDEEIGAMVLIAAAMQKGTITAAGKPVAGAAVAVAGGAGYETVTDAEGRYSASDLTRWANRIVIIHPDFAILDENLGPFGSAKKGLDRSLNNGAPITGRVVSGDGQTPVPNAGIYVDNWQLATTTADGTFTIEHARKDWSMVEARVDNRAGARAHANGTLTIKLAKTASVDGTLVDARTQMPLAGAEVHLFQGPGLGAGANSSRSAFTNAKGAYTLTPLTPGSYQINATRPGNLIPNVSLSVVAGQTVHKALYANARGRIVGSVVDEDKRAVSGARIVARSATARDQMMMMPGMRGGQEATAYSAPDGRFVLRSVMTESDIQVDAAKKGFPPGRSASLKLAPAERKSGIVITIPRGIALTGKVTDRDGRPLSGVGVEAVESANDGGFGGMRRMVVNLMRTDRVDEVVRTRSDGTFTIRVKEGTYDVVFKRDGFASKSIRGQVINATAKPLAVALEPGVEISGRVTRSGVGVEGIDVGAIGPDGVVTSVTGSDGSFRLEDLTPGQMMLNVNKREEFIQQIRPVTAPSQNVNIDLPPGGRISGRVVDKSSHNPVTTFQAGISTSRSGGGMVIQTPPILKAFTTDDGTFTLENVPAGPTQIVVSAPGYTTAHVPGINVEDGKPIGDVEVDLETGAKLSGRVTGPDGGPLAGVSVRPDMSGGPRVMRFDGMDTNTITDPNGEYSIEALEAGEKTFTFSRQGYLTESRTITVSGSSNRLDVQLSSGVRLSGTVVNESGAPVPDAVVSASSASQAGFGGERASTDAGGGFQIDGLAPGHYTLTATKNGFGNGILRDFDVAAGTPARITMKSGSTISGHVTGLTEQELQNATVMINSTTGNASAPIDSTGNYHIDGAPSGTVRVSATTGQMFGGSRKTSPMKSINVDPGSSAQVDLEFKTTTVIRGHVTRDGQPMQSASISFFPRGAQSTTNASATTDSSGNYEVNGLDDAQYSVQIVDFSRTAPFSTTYEVKGSGTFDIDIKALTIRGHVLDATSGTPIANATIEIHSSTGEAFLSSRAANTDSSGNFIIDNVTRGNYDAKAEKDGYGHALKTFTVGDTGTDEIEFKLSPSDGITLTVVDARDNRTLAANVVQIVDGQGQNVDAAPAFRFSGTAEPLKLTLAPGLYRVTIAAPGYASQTVSVTSPSNQRVGMTPGGTLVIRSKSGALVRARLVDSSGMPYVRGMFMGGGGIFTIDPAPGVTTLQNVAPGTFRLQILDGDRVINTIPVTVVEGQQTQLEV